jgi:hypothetical protein
MPNLKKIRASRDSLICRGGGLVSRVSRAARNFINPLSIFYMSETFPRVRVDRTN